MEGVRHGERWGSAGGESDDELTQESCGVLGGADEGDVRVEEVFLGGEEFAQFETVGVLSGNSEGVGVERAVLLFGEMLGGLGREFFEGLAEEEGLGRFGESVSFHEVLYGEEVAESREDGDKENADGGFVFGEEAFEEFERALGAAGGEGVAEFEDDGGAGEGDDLADIGFRDWAGSVGEVEGELVDFGEEDASVAAGADGEEFESFWIEAQSERGGESLGKLHGGFLPAWLG
ncbi:MAG: hypothetical protein RLZZ399_841, partial [Verrucomicrobiota bacterium]